MKLMMRNFAIVVAMFSMVAIGMVNAQVSKGSISGTIVDPSGAAVIGADIKATNAGTNQSVTTTSGGAGAFNLALLPVGLYKLEVSKSGFRKASVGAVEVTPGVDAGLGAIKLEIGSTSETVEVSASTPLVETTQAQITNTFESTYLNNIPGI